jgi:HD-GYP domain-containing protein (c-di-GMP phosphodiesterase class II)
MVFGRGRRHGACMPPAVVSLGARRETRESGDRRSVQHAASPACAAIGSAVKDALLKLLSEQNGALVAHLAGVAELAAVTAARLGLSPSQVELTRLGAELHDIGKIAIPAKILDKPGPLDAEEQWFVQRHSEIGERILAATPELREVAPMVRAVHERPDGLGYPDGLLLEAIPVCSRIIAVVDAFDAMTNDRPYQRAMSLAHALAELALHAGTQFDPAVVDAFTQAVSERWSAPRAA